MTTGECKWCGADDCTDPECFADFEPRPPVTTDDLAGILLEHRSWSEVCDDTEGWHYECLCGETLPTNDGHFEAWEDLAAHQAAVIAAAGWVKGREEFGVRDGEDVDEIEPSTRGWAERVAAADNAHLRRNGMEGESIVVRRHVTDWEEA